MAAIVECACRRASRQHLLPSTNFANCLPSSFGFLSKLWFKTDAGHSFGKIENDCRIENPVFGKARIEHFDRGIRISFAWLQARRFSGVLGEHAVGPTPRGRLARARAADKKHREYSKHGYFPAVEAAFLQRKLCKLEVTCNHLLYQAGDAGANCETVPLPAVCTGGRRVSLRRQQVGGFEKTAGLAAPERGIMAVMGNEFPMAALLDDAAIFEHDQAIHLRDGGEPVRDRD